MQASGRHALVAALLLGLTSSQANAQGTSDRHAKLTDVCGPRANSTEVKVTIVDLLTNVPVGSAQSVITDECIASANDHGELIFHHVPLGPTHFRAAFIGYLPTDTIIDVVAGHRQNVLIRLRSPGPQPFTIEPLPANDLRSVVIAALQYLVTQSQRLAEHADTLRRIVGATVESAPESPTTLLDLRRDPDPAWIPAGGLPSILAEAGLAGSCAKQTSSCTHNRVVILYAVEAVARLGPDSVYVRVWETLWDQTICMGDEYVRGPLIVRHAHGWAPVCEAAA